jgi:hypothetical protein
MGVWLLFTRIRLLVDNFPKLLERANKFKPLFIILDSLDQLSNEDNGLSLRYNCPLWLNVLSIFTPFLFQVGTLASPAKRPHGDLCSSKFTQSGEIVAQRRK